MNKNNDEIINKSNEQEKTSQQYKNVQEETKQIVERLREGGLWQPMGTGLSYVKQGDKTLILISQEDKLLSVEARIRMEKLLKSIEWTVDDSICEIIDAIEELTPEQRQERDIETWKTMSKKWECPRCGMPLYKFPLGDENWSYDGQYEMVSETGKVTFGENWTVTIKCHCCDTKVPLNEDDFSILVHDKILPIYKTSNMIYRAANELDIIDTIDNKWSDNLILLGTFCPFHGDRLPRYVRGKAWFYSEIKEEK